MHHFQIVDSLEFFFLGFGRTGHACQFVIHAEEVLEGDRRQRHRLFLHLDALLWPRSPDADLRYSADLPSSAR